MSANSIEIPESPPGETALNSSPLSPVCSSTEPSAYDLSDEEPSLPLRDAKRLLSRGIWTLLGYGASLGVRFGSNLVLARLLAPQIFGVMVVVNGLRMGIELLTDVGVEQNIVHSDRGMEDQFFNTAWTVQMLRGLLLTALFLALSTPLARFYAIDIKIFWAVSLIPLVNSLHSTSVFVLVKKLDVRKRNIFEFGSEFIGFLACVLLALHLRSIWALIGGTLLATAFRSGISYWLPHPPHRLVLDRGALREIIHFGKWIFFSSFALYCAGNVDRLTLGKLVPFALLGVYGMARTIAEIPATLASRLGYQIVFPFLASRARTKRGRTKQELARVRLKICLAGAILISLAIVWADRAVALMYDVRYREAGWILSLLLFGTWFSILSNLNEAVLLGYGRPSYGTYANAVRLIAVAVLLPLSFRMYGIEGAVGVMIAAEVIRYTAIAVGQHLLQWSFYRQDLLCTLVLLIAVAVWVSIRQHAGLGSPWDMPGWTRASSVAAGAHG